VSQSIQQSQSDLETLRGEENSKFALSPFSNPGRELLFLPRSFTRPRVLLPLWGHVIQRRTQVMHKKYFGLGKLVGDWSPTERHKFTDRLIWTSQWFGITNLGCLVGRRRGTVRLEKRIGAWLSRLRDGIHELSTRLAHISFWAFWAPQGMTWEMGWEMRGGFEKFDSSPSLANYQIRIRCFNYFVHPSIRYENGLQCNDDWSFGYERRDRNVNDLQLHAAASPISCWYSYGRRLSAQWPSPRKPYLHKHLTTANCARRSWAQSSASRFELGGG